LFQNTTGKQRTAGIVVAALLIFVLISILIITYLLFTPWSVPSDEEGIRITIQRGMTPQAIARLLHGREVIPSSARFLWAGKIMGVNRALQAGEYRFQGRLNNYTVLRMLSRGRVIYEKVTFPEGTQAIHMADILENRLGLNRSRFIALLQDTGMVRKLNVPGPGLEGYLYPDTYFFPRNATPEQILETMVERFFQVFSDSLQVRAGTINMSVREVVTLASIVEGEAILDSERATIAAIYLNRLKRNMLLQACPTIQYIIDDGPRRLLTKDLEIESPYNTYLHAGLPPGPVNNPGRASLLAVLYPARVDYLYMVANGDGSHTFSRNLQDHLRAKRHFDRNYRSRNP
jgi:UPF0755 protein